MKRKIKSIEYLCGGHGFKADTTMFALRVEYQTGDGTPQTFFGYLKDGVGYIFATMIDCIRYYANGEYVENRISIDDDSLAEILELEGVGFDLFEAEGVKYYFFNN